MIENKTACFAFAFLVVLLVIGFTAINTKDVETENSQRTKEFFEETSETIEQTTQIEVVTIYDVPLSDELQIHTQKMCKKYNVPFDLVVAIMHTESRFQQTAKNDNCYGLMQVHEINMEQLSEIGINDLTDPFQNIESGVFLLAKAFDITIDTTDALVIYNNGYSAAVELWKSGVVETDYTREVLNYVKTLKVKERVYTVFDT